MKASHLLICGFAIFTQVALQPAHAESILFTRTDSNNVQASSAGTYYDTPHLYSDYEHDWKFHNTLANAGVTKTFSSPGGSFQFLGLSNASSLTGTSGSTYTPNIFCSSLVNVGWEGTGTEPIFGNTGNANTTFQVQPPIDPDVDTIILNGTIDVTHGATGYYGGSWLFSGGRIGDTTVSVSYDSQLNTYEVNVYHNSSIVWTEAIGPNVSYTFTVESIVSPYQNIPVTCGTNIGSMLQGGPSWYELILSSSAECSMTATGYDSSVDPPDFSGTRIYMQRIVDDEEEEQDPPVLIYDSES